MSKDIQSKIFFTVLILAVFAIGSSIPVPGMDKDILANIFTNENSGLFELYDLFTGGSFQNFTLFALGVTPYITATIIIQLLTIAFPRFGEMSKDGTVGRKKLAAITRYTAVGLALLQGTGMTLGLFRRAIIDRSALSVISIVLMLTAGTTILMWLGEQVNEYGVGNGMSLLIFAGIAMRIPVQIREVCQLVKAGTLQYFAAVLIAAAAVALAAMVIYIQGGERRVPVQYAKRVIGRKQIGGQSTHIPIKLNISGVIPIIFAVSVLQLPLTITYFVPGSKYTEFVSKYLSPGGTVGIWVYMALNIVLVTAFTFFYKDIIFKPDEIASQLKANGGSVPAVRPGKPTEAYLRRISGRLSLIDALFLAAISTIPTAVGAFTPLNLTFGGTSLLILTGVALDTAKQIENRQMMQSHRGFLK